MLITNNYLQEELTADKDLVSWAATEPPRKLSSEDDPSKEPFDELSTNRETAPSELEE